MKTLPEFRKAFFKLLATEIQKLLPKGYSVEPGDAGVQIYYNKYTACGSLYIVPDDHQRTFVIKDGNRKDIANTSQLNDVKWLAEKVVKIALDYMNARMPEFDPNWMSKPDHTHRSKRRSALREQVIKLAHANPELRKDLLPLLSDKEASADSLNAAIKSWWASLAKKINGKGVMKVKSISEKGLEVETGHGSMRLMRVYAEMGMIKLHHSYFGSPPSNLTMDMSQKYIADAILEIPNFLSRLAKTKESK